MIDQPIYDHALAAVHEADFSDHARGAGDLLRARLELEGHDAGLVIDLGCGGGTLAQQLAGAGYDVLGVDLSPAMIGLARRRVPGARFVVGSIWDVALPAAVAVAAIGEVVNYAADVRAGLAQLEALVDRARAALPAGGVLLFDVATPGRAGPDGTTTSVRDAPAYWLHATAREIARADGAMLERRVVLFRRDGSCYRRSDEVHHLRLYEPAEIEAMLARAGFDVTRVAAYGNARLAPGWVGFLAVARR